MFSCIRVAIGKFVLSFVAFYRIIPKKRYNYYCLILVLLRHLKQITTRGQGNKNLSYKTTAFHYHKSLSHGAALKPNRKLQAESKSEFADWATTRSTQVLQLKIQSHTVVNSQWQIFVLNFLFGKGLGRFLGASL